MKDLLLDKISLEGIEISHPTNAIVKVKCQPTACFFNIQASQQLMGFSTRSKVCKVLLGIIAPGILPQQKNPQELDLKKRIKNVSKHMWQEKHPNTSRNAIPMRHTLEMFSMSMKKRSASLRSDTSTIHRCSQVFDHQVALADGSSQSKPSNHEPNDEWSRSPLSNALRPLMKEVDDPRILRCFWCLFNSNNHWFQQHWYSPMLCRVQ